MCEKKASLVQLYNLDVSFDLTKDHFVYFRCHICAEINANHVSSKVQMIYRRKPRL